MKSEAIGILLFAMLADLQHDGVKRGHTGKIEESARLKVILGASFT